MPPTPPARARASEDSSPSLRLVVRNSTGGPRRDPPAGYEWVLLRAEHASYVHLWRAISPEWQDWLLGLLAWAASVCGATPAAAAREADRVAPVYQPRAPRGSGGRRQRPRR